MNELPPDFVIPEVKIRGPFARDYRHRYPIPSEEEQASRQPTGAAIAWGGVALFAGILIAMYVLVTYLPLVRK